MSKQKVVCYRQGDVMPVLVSALPAGAVQVQSEDKRVVLAYGEVTGHAHAVYENTESLRMWAVGKVRYLEVMAGAMVTPEMAAIVTGKHGPQALGDEAVPGVALKHEEHTFHVLPPGVYKLPVQTEYTPAELRITRD